jgi:hypothetical protein
MQGFISWMAMTVGHRMMTVTAWETPEDHRHMYDGGTHPQAVQKFLGPELAAGGMTSVWSSGRFAARYVCIWSISQRLRANARSARRCQSRCQAARGLIA